MKVLAAATSLTMSGESLLEIKFIPGSDLVCGIQPCFLVTMCLIISTVTGMG